jgi:hypothetical protein
MADQSLPSELLQTLCILGVTPKSASWTLNHTHCGSVTLNVTWTKPGAHCVPPAHAVSVQPPVVVTRKSPGAMRRDARRNQDFWRQKTFGPNKQVSACTQTAQFCQTDEIKTMERAMQTVTVSVLRAACQTSHCASYYHTVI